MSKTPQEKLNDIYAKSIKGLVPYYKTMISDEEVLPSPLFHTEISDILLNGTKHFAIEAFRQSAKALSLDTKVPTPYGFTTIGDIDVGDKIFDDKGNICNVIKTTEVFKDRTCYKVIFDDKTEIIADAGHLWTVLDKHKRKFQTHTTEYLKNNINLGAKRRYQEFAFRIPVCDSLELENKELPIDPYILGLWLGDGNSSGAVICLGEKKNKCIDYIKDNWEDVSIVNDEKNNHKRVSIKNGFLTLLRDNNLLNNKNIPKEYLRASHDQRLALLRGLMDTDGTVAKNGTKTGTCTITSVNEEMSYQIKELVCSLGIKATILQKEAKIKGRYICEYWSIAFKTTLEVCSIPFKKDKLPETQDKRSLMRSIVKIEEHESVPVKCIGVDSESHLFLVTDKFIPTHNTSLVLQAFPLYCLTFPQKNRSYIVLIKQNQTLASQKLKEIADLYTTHPLLKLNLVKVKEQSAKAFECVVYTKGMKKMTIRIEAFGKGSAIRGLSWGTKRPDIVVADDLQDLEDSMSETVQDKDWIWFLSDIKPLGKNTRIFMIGNNLGERCLIERIIENKANLDFETMRIAALDDKGEPTWAEMFSKEYLQKEKDDYTVMGTIDIWYRERMCVAMSEEGRLFKKEYFRHFEEDEIRDLNMKYYIAVDPAISQKESADDTAIVVVGIPEGKHAWYVVEIIARKLKPNEIIDILFQLNEKYRPIKIGVESVSFQQSLIIFMEEEMKRRGEYPTVVELKANSKKELRISGLQSRFKVGEIRHRPHMLKLEEQLLAFPRGLHDDVADALAYISQLTDINTGNVVSAYDQYIKDISL